MCSQVMCTGHRWSCSGSKCCAGLFRTSDRLQRALTPPSAGLRVAERREAAAVRAAPRVSEGDRHRFCICGHRHLTETHRPWTYSSLTSSGTGSWSNSGTSSGFMCLCSFVLLIKCLCHALRSDVVTFRNTSETHYDA